MKRFIIFFLLLSCSLQLSAQGTSTFKTRYNRLSKVGGPAGLGIETLLHEWEDSTANDRDLMAAKFSFYLTKSKSDVVIPLKKERYLGQKPLFELQDSLGNKIKYFSDVEFNDSLYFKALEIIDSAVDLYPDDLDLRLGRIAAVIIHEKENQDEAMKETLALLDYNAKNKPEWIVDGKKAEDSYFEDQIQDCCFEFYNIGSDSSYEAFKTISEKASKMYPRNTAFLNNLGVYWLVAKANPQKAIGYYKKVLKINPDEESATKNIKLAQREMDKKKKKK